MGRGVTIWGYLLSGCRLSVFHDFAEVAVFVITECRVNGIPQVSGCRLSV